MQLSRKLLLQDQPKFTYGLWTEPGEYDVSIPSGLYLIEVCGGGGQGGGSRIYNSNTLSSGGAGASGIYRGIFVKTSKTTNLRLVVGSGADDTTYGGAGGAAETAELGSKKGGNSGTYSACVPILATKVYGWTASLSAYYTTTSEPEIGDEVWWLDPTGTAAYAVSAVADDYGTIEATNDRGTTVTLTRAQEYDHNLYDRDVKYVEYAAFVAGDGDKVFVKTPVEELNLNGGEWNIGGVDANKTLSYVGGVTTVYKEAPSTTTTETANATTTKRFVEITIDEKVYTRAPAYDVEDTTASTRAMRCIYSCGGGGGGGTGSTTGGGGGGGGGGQYVDFKYDAFLFDNHTGGTGGAASPKSGVSGGAGGAGFLGTAHGGAGYDGSSYNSSPGGAGGAGYGGGGGGAGWISIYSHGAGGGAAGGWPNGNGGQQALPNGTTKGEDGTDFTATPYTVWNNLGEEAETGWGKGGASNYGAGSNGWIAITRL